ncbi:alpha/beta hydrolase [Roseobacter ponti]|uniref:Proline iminopeptidase n=1 Tax=Roseobacter ponti TaxID=1891787 RepID=A0A858SVD5_9RHOB|nr:alpha/beta hydrolase [Roseobacter ponti]QJF51623.1 alpha/beta hydrolase [Roseobacter ponti]
MTGADCTRPLAPLEIEGQTIRCGFVTVPVDHAVPDGPTLRLAFAFFKAHSTAPARDPVIHLHGGPGGGIVERVAKLSTYFDKLRRSRDIIVFDQRGVDASGETTRCVTTLADNIGDILLSRTGEGPATLDADLTRACIAELTDRGLELEQINSEQNALDVEAVAAAFGAESYNLYGVSYGTKLSLEVMRNDPPGLRAVVLDSVAPSHIALFDNLFVPNYEAVQSIGTLCEADAKCAAAYPDIVGRYWGVVNAMTDAPLQSATGPVTGDAFNSLVEARNSSEGPKGLTTYIPKMVAEFEAGDTTTWDAFQAREIPPQTSGDKIIASATGLSADEVTLAWNAVRAAEQIGLQTEIATRNLQSLEADVDADRTHSALADVFDAALGAAITALPEKQSRLEFASDYLRLAQVSPDASKLDALLVAHFDGDTLEQLQGLVRVMSVADIVDTFARSGTDNAEIQQVIAGEFEQRMYSCQEDMDINSVSGVRASFDQMPEVPALLSEFYVAYLGDYYSKCALFDQHYREGWHDPVHSDVPTLVLAGLSDTQTAVSWARDAASYLSDARTVVLPETGHAALTFSNCAQDLGEAFINAPETALTTTCATDLTPPFLLPDGTMSVETN